MNSPTILVCGLGRCGSSLLMQMLDAAGVPTIGTYPAFEDEGEVLLRQDPEAWRKLTAGHAVKILNPHQAPPPAAGDYRTIFLVRDLAQQAVSTHKFIGLPSPRRDRRALEVRLAVETRQARKALEKIGTGQYLSIPFELLVKEPLDSAASIASYVRGYRDKPLDPAVMAGRVVPRGTDCLPYMLERDLLESHLCERRSKLVAEFNYPQGEFVR